MDTKLKKLAAIGISAAMLLGSVSALADLTIKLDLNEAETTEMPIEATEEPISEVNDTEMPISEATEAPVSEADITETSMPKATEEPAATEAAGEPIAAPKPAEYAIMSTNANSISLTTTPEEVTLVDTIEDVGASVYCDIYNDGTIIMSGAGVTYCFDSGDFGDHFPSPFYSRLNSNDIVIDVIYIEDGITMLGDELFDSVSYTDHPVSKVYIPLSVTEICIHAFTGVDVSDVYYAGTETQWNEIKMGYRGWTSLGGYSTGLEGATIHYSSGIDISSAAISAVSSQTYTGSAITPTPTVTFYGTTLTKDTDYTLSYSNNTNIGTATITITGKGSYSGTATTTFTISAQAISSATVADIAAQTYTGSAVTPTPTLTYNGKTLVQDTDYVLSYSDNKYPGTATVTAVGIGNYTGTATKTFTISAAPISSVTIADIAAQTYTGSAVTPTPTLTHNGKTLIKDVDYTLSYANNTNAGTATVTITGMGNFTGTTTKTFEISAADISSASISGISSQTYTGSAITPEPTLTYAGKTLTKGTDYSLSYSNNVSAGSMATITITGKGNFSGTTTTSFNISNPSGGYLSPGDAGLFIWTSSGKTNFYDTVYTYTGSEIEPLTGVAWELQTEYDTYGDGDGRVDVTYSNNINVGTGIIHISIVDFENYEGGTAYVEYDFQINPAPIPDAAIADMDAQTYTGSAITPEPVLTYNGKTLTKDVDYTLSYSNNTNAGTATVTITGMGNFTGTTTKTFAINARAVSEADITNIPATQTYTGSAFTPAPTLTFNGKTLVQGTDYTVAYSNNTNAGTATVTITGKGNFKGTATKTFIILAKSLSGAAVSSIGEQVYTGNAITPSFTVTSDGKTLVKDTDYSVAYSNNTNAGTATVTITGKGNYTGTVTKTFTISARAISSATISDIAAQTYTGSAFTPEPVLTYNGKTLVQGTDYTLSYSNNTNAGTATITITGKGNFKGTTSTTFTILAASLSGAAVTFPDDISYQGEPCEPEVTVILDGKTLVLGQDYTVSYSNNNDEGTGTATIAGIGNYAGTLTEEFEIGPFVPKSGIGSINLNDNTLVEGSVDGTFIFDGNAKEPKPALIYHFVNPTTNVALDYTLIEGTDYNIVSYRNNINAGTAAITIEGIGTFEGERDIYFVISPCELSATTIADISSAEYCKKDICPEPEIKIGDKVMVKDVDYTVEYENNRNRGTASVIITGKGNLTGTITKTFEITPRDGTKFTIIVLW